MEMLSKIQVNRICNAPKPRLVMLSLRSFKTDAYEQDYSMIGSNP